MTEHVSASTSSHLRLVWPQWQGAGTSSVRDLAPEFTVDVARRGYAVGAAVLGAVLPPHAGPTAAVPVSLADDGLELRDGMEAKAVVLEQLTRALEVIGQHDPARITTLGGECSVSVAPFAALADRYGDDLAVLWVDSPRRRDGRQRLPGLPRHGRLGAGRAGRRRRPGPAARHRRPVPGGPGRFARLDRRRPPQHRALGFSSFSPDDLRTSSRPVLDWLARTGCSRLAVHVDVDVVDSDEVVLGLRPRLWRRAGRAAQRAGPAGGGRPRAAVDAVGLSVAEFVPRQVMHLQRLLRGFPLLADPA